MNEDRIQAVERSINHLGSQVSGLKATVEAATRLAENQEIDRRVRNLEMDVANNNQVVKIVRWLAVAICGSGITVAATMIAEAIV